MNINYVTSQIVKGAVIANIVEEFKQDIADGSISDITEEMMPQFANRPTINIRQRRVSQEKGIGRTDLTRLYMFDVQYLHPFLEDSTGINFNEIADEISSRLMFALETIEVPFYFTNEKLELEEGIDKVRANSIEDSKDINVLTVMSSYSVRMDIADNLDLEKIQEYGLNVYLKEVINGR